MERFAFDLAAKGILELLFPETRQARGTVVRHAGMTAGVESLLDGDE